MAESLFSKIIKKEIPAEIVYEDKDFIAILDTNPVNPGHTLLIPKEIYVDLFDMPDKLLEKIGPVLKKLSKAVVKSTKADGLNIGMNNKKAAGQVIFHAHIHIMPRFEGDKYELWHGKPYKEGEIAKIADGIRSQL